MKFAVIGVFDEDKYDGGRFAETFDGSTVQEAEQLAEKWAEDSRSGGEHGVIIAGVIEGPANAVA